ncbi:SIR2 family protein [Erythrobacter sp. F6033]|uniref:SIR2 family protein n=1 Tax=Erythrobacter sp. F6033 TaxID=2926401 RepID=UPI001FF323AB|nr:SIR2 family protein [Erythrobacter sp. F6033]MCK0128171.1 SIR2 family protein [Erythrobacter sp. F6033]
MKNNSKIRFYDEDALLYRLHEGVGESNKGVVFVVGAPITAPTDEHSGVTDVEGVVDLIREEFSSKPAQIKKLENDLAKHENRYQAAFDFLVSRRGQDAANRVVKRAVSTALIVNTDKASSDTISGLDTSQLQSFENDPNLWSINEGVNALSKLIVDYPSPFGNAIITSNFDPLLEIAIQKNGGNAWRTTLSSDGSLFDSQARGCQVIHMHGFWHGSDTLHTPTQLLQDRPQLANDFLKIVADKIVVVMAYGGWNDIFTEALRTAVKNKNILPEIIWTFFSKEPIITEDLRRTLEPGIAKGRVTLYAGIDCHSFLPKLLHEWEATNPLLAGDIPLEDNKLASSSLSRRARLFNLSPLECDRPPNVEVWVGREGELRALETSKAKVVIFGGLGGEGKSALASHYISTLQQSGSQYRLWDWRDCKEQSDRIRTQIVEIIARFSHGMINSEDLSEANDLELIEVLSDITHGENAVLVFDNVDSYVDLENKKFIGLLDLLVQKFSTSGTSSRLILTCRPPVQYTSSSCLTLTLKGVSLSEAEELFAKRIANHSIPSEDIAEVHAITNGHAFWLDLLAVQVNNVPGTLLRSLIDDLRRGREDGPDVLSSIWETLAMREKTLLRFMAEAVRPETEKTVAKFSSAQLTQNNFQRAIRSLISFNLIVVKPQNDAPDLYDLHPLVRSFVRKRYARSERTDIIRVVINQYKSIIGSIGSLLGVNLPYPLLERWSQKAELEISASMYDDAFETLSDAEDAFLGSGHIQEYVRVCRLLLEAIDWETASSKYKQFDDLVRVTVETLDQLGEYTASDNLIDRYASTIPEKTARFINLCDIRAYSAWQRQNFADAVEWAKKGVDLKARTKVDTAFDCEHHLALALRDSGECNDALDIFLGEHKLEEILDGNDLSKGNGPLYGNVGRCLHLMGQKDDALRCYRKSMRLLERDNAANTMSNRAYARAWIGEIHQTNGRTEEAIAFFVDAARQLGAAAPMRVRKLSDQINSIKEPDAKPMTENAARRLVDKWLRN